MQKELNEIECWKDIVGYEGKYQASSLGRIRTLNYKRTGKTKLLKPGITSGYYRVVLCENGKEKNMFVQRLVYSAFHGTIPPGMQINHLNENKLDNRIENLELVTAKENINWGTRNERAAASNRGKKHTEETKAKLSAAAKARWERKKLGE